MSREDSPLHRAAWISLRCFTDARIALGRAGASLPTEAHLAFQLAHARARDAVHASLDTEALQEGLRERQWQSLLLHSAARDRREYLIRPDLGRCLDEPSRNLLVSVPDGGCDVVFVIADGLSATAVNRHALPLLDAVLPPLRRQGWQVGPVAIVEQGRVAVGDEVAERLGADLAVVFLGERPGLSAPDSLGVYLTWRPQPAVTTDAERNCLSNIRAEGLSYTSAAVRLLYLLTEARRRSLTGVALKEEAGADLLSE